MPTAQRAPRQLYRTVPGQELEFSDENGRLVATKVLSRNTVDAVYGILDLPGGTDAFVDEIRGRAELP